jgi:AraC-like DNA-binding protein
VDEVIEQAVVRVVKAMRDNLGEQLTIEDMARTAMFSKFHFSRMFREVTGVSPGRFLSALRLQEAKRLLISTSISVVDISNKVGYASVGTFSSRFKSTVGVAPITYRARDGLTCPISIDHGCSTAEARPPTVEGEILAHPADAADPLFVGLFPDRIPQGQPARYTVLNRPGSYVLHDVPCGTWHLLVRSIAPGKKAGAQHDSDLSQRSAGVSGPITIAPDTLSQRADVRLRPMRCVDPPMLLAVPAA